MSDSKKKYVCFMCDKRFTTKFTLGRHLTSIHNLSCDDPDGLSASSKAKCKTEPDVCEMLPCPMCSRNFVKKARVKRHLLKDHPEVDVKTVCPPKIVKSVLCPVCSTQVRNVIATYDHIKTFHPDEDIGECQNLTFETKEEFLDWKSAEEKRSLSSFVVKNNRKGARTHRYYCHRSGTYRTSGASKRHLKNQGSCKIGSRCPAYIKATFTEYGVNVTYVEKHIGHDLEIKHIRLLKEERLAIAEMIAEGNTKDEVLERVRDNLSSTEFSRLHLLRRADLNNIMMEFKLGNNNGNTEYESTWPGEGVEIVVESAIESISSSPVTATSSHLLKKPVVLRSLNPSTQRMNEGSSSEFNKLRGPLHFNLVNAECADKTNQDLKTLLLDVSQTSPHGSLTLGSVEAILIDDSNVEIKQENLDYFECENSDQRCSNSGELVFRKGPLLTEDNAVTCTLAEWEEVVSEMREPGLYLTDQSGIYLTDAETNEETLEHSYVAATTSAQGTRRYIPSSASHPVVVYRVIDSTSSASSHPVLASEMFTSPLAGDHIEVVTSLDVDSGNTARNGEVIELVYQSHTDDWGIS